MATLNPHCKTHLLPKMVALKNAKETKKLIGFSKKGSLTISFHGVSLCILWASEQLYTDLLISSYDMSLALTNDHRAILYLDEYKPHTEKCL